MTAPPIPMTWMDGSFHPLPNFLRVAREHYGEGEIVALVPHEERSQKSHAHYFACVHEAWQNLPEALAARFPTDDALRYHALIRTGHCNVTAFACMFKTEARRLAAALAAMDPYSMVVVEDRIVTRYTAKSQRLKAMGKEAFQKSKDDVLGFLADMIGVEIDQLARARAA